MIKKLKINLDPLLYFCFKAFLINIFFIKNEKLVLLEAGCGVGNAFFPILNELDNVFVYACDFSPKAIQYVKVRLFQNNSCHVFKIVQAMGALDFGKNRVRHCTDFDI